MLVASWNVNSMNVRLPHVLAWLQEHKPDVVCIQETKMTDDKFPHKEFADLGYHAEFFGEKAYNGVAILSLAKPDAVKKGFTGEKEPFARRFIEASFGALHVLNVYIPNGQEVGSEKFIYKLNWIEQLKEHLNKQHKKDELLVICGDFNVATEDRDVYDPKELEGQILCSQQERDAIQSLKDWGLVDTFRIHEQDGGFYSWWDYRQGGFRRNHGLRIDHIWATEPLALVCKRVWIDKEPRKLERPSDHTPTVAEFAL